MAEKALKLGCTFLERPLTGNLISSSIVSSIDDYNSIGAISTSAETCRQLESNCVLVKIRNQLCSFRQPAVLRRINYKEILCGFFKLRDDIEGTLSTFAAIIAVLYSLTEISRGWRFYERLAVSSSVGWITLTHSFTRARALPIAWFLWGEGGRKRGRKEGGMEGRKEGGTEGRKEGGTEGRKEGGMEGRKEGGMEGRKEGRMEGRKEGGTEGRKEGGTKGRKEGETKGREKHVLVLCIT